MVIDGSLAWNVVQYTGPGSDQFREAGNSSGEEKRPYTRYCGNLLGWYTSPGSDQFREAGNSTQEEKNPMILFGNIWS